MTVEGVVKTANGTSIGTVTTMPSASSKLSGASVLYLGADGTNYHAGTIYECTGSGSSWTWTAKGTISDVSFTSALKSKLDGISDSADAVSFTQTLASGTKIGTITINGESTDLYSTLNNNVSQTTNNRDGEFPILLKNTTDATNDVAATGFNSGITVNPSAKTVTATTFKGALSGNASTATKATQDASGNVITTTYATKTEMGNKLDKTAKAASAGTADKATSDASGNVIADTYATKASLADYAKTSDISNIYRYKSSVAGVANLPTSGQAVGDAYNVESEFTYGGKKYPAGTNVAWNGTAWDPLGGTVDLTPYQTKAVGTASRALVTDTSGNIAVSAVTSAELGYLGGVTSNVQTQISAVKTTADGAIQQGGTLSKPLTVTGGDSATAGKIALSQSGKGQITDSSTATLFGFTSADTLTIGSGTYNVNLRGKQTRPVWNTKSVAMLSDVPSVSVLSAAGASVTWASNTTVAGFSYRGTITLSGCTTSHMPVVTFTAAQAKSGNYSSYAESGAGVVYIWSKVNTSITVDVVAVKS